MASTIEARIRDSVDAFVAELTDLVRDAALESVHEALTGTSASATRRSSSPTRKPSSTPRTAKVRRGSRRSAGDVEATQRAVVDYVRANKGCSVTDIASATGLSTKDLQLPMRKLVADGKLRTTGQRRGTRYLTSRGGGAPKKTAKKATRRKSTKKSPRGKTTRKSSGRKKKVSRSATAAAS
ncbi:MAG: hypothetical protein GY711_31320 [bacterium]|nr:hypothetical protein [bacterium]